MTVRTVWKYNLDHNPLVIHGAGKIVHVGIDVTYSLSLPTVWVERVVDEVGEDAIVRPLMVTFFGTGHHIDDDEFEHQGSVVTDVGLVWHVYAKRT